MNNDSNYLIKAPVLTEESTLQQREHNKYVFRVDPRANKKQIRDAVETMFNVEVLTVRTMNYAGKTKGQMRRQPGRRANWKKAIVTLAPENTIDLL